MGEGSRCRWIHRCPTSIAAVAACPQPQSASRPEPTSGGGDSRTELASARRHPVRPVRRHARHRAGRRAVRLPAERGGDAVDRWFGTEAGTAAAHRSATHCAARSTATSPRSTPLLSEQVDAILHDTRLRRLEGTWRGIAWLVDGTDQSSRLKIKLLNAGWHEICRDLERAIEFDQSHLFRKSLRRGVRHARRRAVRPAGGRPRGAASPVRRPRAPTTSTRWPRCPASPRRRSAR